MPKSDKPQLWVCLYDIHHPETDKPTLRAILDFIKKNRVDGVLLGGDNLDFSQMSHHNKGKHILKPRGSLKHDLDTFTHEVLDPIESRLLPNAKKIFHLGNHERFIQDWIDENPELDGMLDIVEYLKLASRGWQVVKLGREYKIGKLTTIHGDTLTGGASAAKKAVETYGTNILLGHFHNPQSYCRTSPVTRRHKFMGWVSPICGAVNAHWTRRRANNWVNGFTIVEVRKNGRFNLYPVIIFDGTFCYGGKTYGVRS